MVTAEFAVVLPAIVLALMVGLVAVATFAMRVRCSDAAQVAARLAARGEPTSAVVAAAARIAPDGAQIHVSVHGGEVAVSVGAVARPPVLGSLLPGFDVSGSFTEPVEPGPPP
jgi:Flp pilus assembly protein TadG